MKRQVLPVPGYVGTDCYLMCKDRSLYASTSPKTGLVSHRLALVVGEHAKNKDNHCGVRCQNVVVFNLPKTSGSRTLLLTKLPKFMFWQKTTPFPNTNYEIKNPFYGNHMKKIVKPESSDYKI